MIHVLHRSLVQIHSDLSKNGASHLCLALCSTHAGSMYAQTLLELPDLLFKSLQLSIGLVQVSTLIFLGQVCAGG